MATKCIINVNTTAIATNVMEKLTITELNIKATIRKSIWSKSGAGFPCPIPTLLFKKLPIASPTIAPNPSKNPTSIPYTKFVQIGV